MKLDSKTAAWLTLAGALLALVAAGTTVFINWKKIQTKNWN